MTHQRITANPTHAAGISFVAYLPLAVALALRVASGPTANISFLVIAAYALLGRAHAIRALALSWLFGMLNSGIAPEATAASIGRYAVFSAAAVSVILHSSMFSRNPRLKPFTLATILLGLFIIAHSFLVSPMADVSILKALSWMAVMATLVSAWLGLSPLERDEVSQQIFWGLVLIMIVSLPLVGTGLGYLRNVTGFQGILNHPQAFGPAMALLGSWAASRLLGERRPSWLLFGIVGLCLFSILMSEARTAGLSMVLAIALSLFVAPRFAGQPILRMAPGLKSGRVWAAIGLALLAGVVLAPIIASTVQHYITKSGRVNAGGAMEAYDQSRGGLIGEMSENIASHPFTGIGFGIASEPETMSVERDPVFGLPLSASVEKGVVPFAVLEELGVFGATFVACWIFALLRRSSRSGLAPFAVCLTALILNMGEATLFSPGGLGLLPMILFAWAYANGTGTMRARRA